MRYILASEICKFKFLDQILKARLEVAPVSLPFLKKNHLKMTSKLLLSVFALTVLLSSLSLSASAYPQEPAPADKNDPLPFVPPLEDGDSPGAPEAKSPAEPAAKPPAEPAAKPPAEPAAQPPADPAAAPKTVAQKTKPRDREPNIIFEPFGQYGKVFSTF